MTFGLPNFVHLTRRDPSRNMARFYVLALEPTLFGEVTLFHNWGRIGTRGQVRIETFDGKTEACGARDKVEQAKRKKGYSEPIPPSLHQYEASEQTSS